MDESLHGFDDHDDEFSGYYDEDGNRISPELIPKPSLCLLCVNDTSQKMRELCDITRIDHGNDDGEFECGMFCGR